MKRALQRINLKLEPSFLLFSKDGKLDFYTWTELGPRGLCGVGLLGEKGKKALRSEGAQSYFLKELSDNSKNTCDDLPSAYLGFSCSSFLFFFFLWSYKFNKSINTCSTYMLGIGLGLSRWVRRDPQGSPCSALWDWGWWQRTGNHLNYKCFLFWTLWDPDGFWLLL